MIEDRLQMPREALEHLDKAIAVGVPDARHRLLIHLYRARAWMRLNDRAQADAALADMQAERKAVKEWHTLLNAQQADALREVVAADVEAAEALLNGTIDVTALGT